MKHLVTPRLLMRPLGMADLDDLHILYSDPDAAKYLSERGGPIDQTRISLEMKIRSFEEHEYGIFSVIERKEKRFIGICGLEHGTEADEPELQLALLPSARGKGYGTEAAMEVLRSAFRIWHIGKVIAFGLEDLRSSTRILEKLGMSYIRRVSRKGISTVLYSIENAEKPPGPLIQRGYRHTQLLSLHSL